MKRLIDANLMALNESEAYMSAQTKIESPITLGLNSVVHRKIQQLIADTPTVDAVEVVRCKDCKYKRLTRGSIDVKSYSCVCSYSPCRARIVEPHFFCFYGEEEQKHEDD